MELYDWQKECLNTWRENRDRGIINVITGAGKTVLALAAMQDLFQRFPNTQIKIVVPTITLAKQWKNSSILLLVGETLTIPIKIPQSFWFSIRFIKNS